MSRYLQKGDGVIPLTEDDRQNIMQVTTEMAGEAMRVMAAAYTELSPQEKKLSEVKLKAEMVFVGLVGMADPPREEARVAIDQCRQAGIKVVMITGDHKITAESIARQLKLPPGQAIVGDELKAISDEELFEKVTEVSIFARIEPLQKLRIVNALKKRGNIVAMTGDGVNDAPALKAANIGIAMGITGTDVAKEVGDMILADDNFASIVAAVEEGRAIFNRLRNVIFFLLSTNLGELLALILAILFTGKAPLLAVQIIWINLVTDTAAAVPLGFEPKYGDELTQPPRHSSVGLLFPGLIYRILFLSGLMSLGVFLIFNWAQARMDLAEARTIAFCTMVAFEWFRAFNARSDEHHIFQMGLFRNRWLILFITAAILLQLAVIYLPFLQPAFSTVPIGLDRWAIAIAAGGSLFIIEEVRKMVLPRLFSRGKWQPTHPES
jgi:Ca2+-transporting ATPase